MTRFLFLLLPLFLVGCVQPVKLIEQGDYAGALERSSRQIRQGRIKATELAALEASFYLITQQDSLKVAEMRASARPEIWPAVYQVAGRIDERQEKISKLLSALEESGYYPSLNFYPAKTLLKEAAEKSALFHYANAQACIPTAHGGNRPAARQAYEELSHCLSYVANFKDAAVLQLQMRELGTVHILLSPVGNPRTYMEDPGMVQTLFWGYSFPVSADWVVIHIEPDRAPTIDFEVNFYFTNLSVSADQETTSTCTSSKEVEDGFLIKKVWSEADSTYVEVQEQQYKTVSATVTTIAQYKDAGACVKLVVLDAATFEPVNTKVFWGSADWSNEYSTTSGDDRALPGSCSGAGGIWCAFPMDSSLLEEAIDDIRWGFWRYLQQVENY